MPGSRRPAAGEETTSPVDHDTAVAALPAEQSLSGAVDDRTDCGVTIAAAGRVGFW